MSTWDICILKKHHVDISTLFVSYYKTANKNDHSSPLLSLITPAFSQPLSLFSLSFHPFSMLFSLSVYSTFERFHFFTSSPFLLVLSPPSTQITARCDDFHTPLNKDSNLISSRPYLSHQPVSESKFKLLFSNRATWRLPAFESKWKYLCKLLRLSASLKGTAIYLNLTANHSAETVSRGVRPEREASINMFGAPANNTISHKRAINLQLCRDKT